LSGLNAYDTQYSKLYIIILKGNDQHLRELCEKSYILNKKFSKNNQQLSEGFQKLQEYLSKPKQYSQNGQ
jgi:crotonobetainyl-CoA:carnitine CoA-transferase CaiB-like acyl-CoA transferase